MGKIICFFCLVFSFNVNSQQAENCRNNLLLVMPTTSFNQCNNNPWVLVFEDDFEGTSLDLSKWHPQTGVPRDPYFGSQKAWHTPENIVVDNGILKIISKKENLYNMPVVTSWSPYTVKYDDFEYTTGEIWTNVRFEYGRFDARIKIPKGKGFFPAYWLYGDIPYYNEIDIFEFWDNSTTNHHMSTHTDYQGNPTLSCEQQYAGVDFSSDYHVFTLIWEPNTIKFYVDGVLRRTTHRYYTTLGQEIGCDVVGWRQYLMNMDYATNPMSIILNTAIQNGTHAPDASTTFPSQMEVDWVRYYKRQPCQDIHITSATQLPLSPINFNVITGGKVNFSCDYVMGSIHQLNIVAKNEINFDPGFTADPGAILETKIDATICPLLKNMIIDDSIRNDNLNINNVINTALIGELPTVLVYPNPNDGNFVINFSDVDFSKYKIKISNTVGEIINSIDDIRSQIVEVNLEDYPRGVYFLYLMNNETKLTSISKIILK